MDKATTLDPNNSEIISFKSRFASLIGKTKLAIELQLKTIGINPVNEFNYFRLGYYYWMIGELTKAEENINHFLLFKPNAGSVNFVMSQVQIDLGRFDKALDYSEKEKDNFWHLYGKSIAVYAMGNKQEANNLLQQFVVEFGSDSWPNIAYVYAFSGEKDEAFKWLELAFENKDASLLEILSYPQMKNLWGDSRWNIFINKLGLPEDHGFHLD